MEIVLKVKGKDKTFVPKFISGRMLRRTLEIGKKLENGIIDPKDLDMTIDYIVELFSEQFTRDEFYDGIQANKLITTIIDCVSEVNGTAYEAMGIDEEQAKNE